jgi:hypothetical protein
MPRVFFSYAHESVEHKDQVLALARFLMARGIVVDLDQWAGPDRQDWGAWATLHIETADFVILVASPDMRVAGDGHAAGHTRRGLQYEMAAVRDLLHRDRPTWVRKLLPVVLPGCSVDHIPLFMQPYAADHYTLTSIDDHGAEELLRALTRQPRDVAPPLGAIPHLPPRGAPVPAGTAPAGPSWGVLAGPVTVRWRPDLVSFPDAAMAGTVEVHLVPVPATTRCTVRRLEQLAAELAELVGPGARWGSSHETAWAHAVAGTPGVAVTRDGQRSAWFPLPRPAEFGAVFDRVHVVDRLTERLTALAGIATDRPTNVAPAVALDPVGLVREGHLDRPPSSFPFPAVARLRVEPEDTIGHAELVAHTREVADELAARLVGRLRAVSGAGG